MRQENKEAGSQIIHTIKQILRTDIISSYKPDIHRAYKYMVQAMGYLPFYHVKMAGYLDFQLASFPATSELTIVRKQEMVLCTFVWHKVLPLLLSPSPLVLRRD